MSPVKALIAYTRQAAGEPCTHSVGLAAELQRLATAAAEREAEQARLITAVTTLSSTSIDRLVESYRATSSTSASCNSTLEPALLAG